MSLKTLTRKTDELTSLLNDFIEPWNDWFTDGIMNKSLAFPHVNITESKDSYNLSLAAPGLEKNDFKIDVEGNILTISAQKEENKEEKDAKYTRKEYNYSSFSRSFTLPDGVMQDKIDAAYENGILKIALPKNEKLFKSSQKSITVK